MSVDTRPDVELRGAIRVFDIPSGDRDLHTAIRGLDLTVGCGESVAAVGPAGCGKSTTLTLVRVSGEPTQDEVPRVGEPGSGAGDKVCFVVRQNASNVMAAPRFCGLPKAEAKRKAHGWPARIGLAVFGHRCQHQLSGSRRKRVALAAPFVSDAEILLMDEPFSVLDVQTRDLKSAEPLESGEATGASVVFVTHGLEESIASAGRVVVMTVGRATVKQVFHIGPRPRRGEPRACTPEWSSSWSPRSSPTGC